MGMSTSDTKSDEPTPAEPLPPVAEAARTAEAARATHVRELGGRSGPEPTRYGDWEMNGRCIDF
jgi:hypothetical protein